MSWDTPRHGGHRQFSDTRHDAEELRRAVALQDNEWFESYAGHPPPKSTKEIVDFKTLVSALRDTCRGLHRDLIRGCDQRCLAERLFPSLFTLLCFVVFALPIWLLAITIGDDVSTDYWVSSWSKLPLTLPILYLVTHFVHVCADGPSKFMIKFCLFGSCVLLLLSGIETVRIAGGWAHDLGSLDCTQPIRKRNLEEHWLNARHYYASCVKTMANNKNMTFQAAVSAFRLGDCANYTAASMANPDWAYLARVENEEHCGGWCVQAQPLWTFQPVRDSCSRAVADVMIRKIRRGAMQVVIYVVVVFVASVVLMNTARPAIKDLHFWP